MKGAVRKAFTNSTVLFYWHRSSGQLLPGREVYFKDRKLSQMTVVTDTDAQFNSVRCTAKKEMSTQTLDITIKLLREWLYLAVSPPLLSPPFQKKRPSSLKNITFFGILLFSFFSPALRLSEISSETFKQLRLADNVCAFNEIPHVLMI